MRLVDGSDRAPIDNATIVVRDGQVLQHGLAGRSRVCSMKNQDGVFFLTHAGRACFLTLVAERVHQSSTACWAWTRCVVEGCWSAASRWCPAAPVSARARSGCSSSSRAQASREPGLYVALEEGPAQILKTADALELSLREATESGWWRFVVPVERVRAGESVLTLLDDKIRASEDTAPGPGQREPSGPRRDESFRAHCCTRWSVGSSRSA